MHKGGSHFAENPVNVDIQRSRFKRPSSHKTTFNAGDLVPIYVDEVLPGDTITMDMGAIVRQTTPIYPVMDNAWCETFWFFVPNRLVWEKWKDFMGENTESYWTQPREYEVPMLFPPDEGYVKGTLADYMGIPTEIGGDKQFSETQLRFSALPFRAYALIWNEWFRDENLKQPCYISRGSSHHQGMNKDNSMGYINSTQYGGELCKVSKPFDYFTACLPAPQKGPDVTIDLGVRAPVYGDGYSMLFSPYPDGEDHNTYPLMEYNGYFGVGTNTEGNNIAKNETTTRFTLTNNKTLGYIQKEELYRGQSSGLYADLSTVNGITVNMLRQSFAIQRLYERDARGGTRYTELIKSHFGVTSPDARMQRPEYLGGNKFAINMDQVIQTSVTTDVSPQGNTAAYSLTQHAESSFTKSFTEHGYIIGLICVRTEHTYQQGLERFWSRSKRFDFYWPSLANIGEQAVLNKEIKATNTPRDNEVFGYQEAWAEYRYKPSRVSSAFRSNYDKTLDAWHYADYYTDNPTLSSAWIDETTANIDRTLSVTSSLEDQFIADFYFKNVSTRPMPMYSIPGLIDHN